MGNAASCNGLCSKKQNPKGDNQGEQVSKTDFKFHHAIGRGGFGKVLLVEKDDKMYAMKEMLKARVMSKKSVDSVKKELELMCRIDSDFIVNVHYAFVDDLYLFLVMDLMQGGDLRFHHIQIRQFQPDQTLFFIACLVQALEAVHDEGIIHRDIKPENLVFDENGYLRLTDFGIAQEWVPINNFENSGTPGYMAPEVMFKQNHGVAADYFAVGVIAYECIMGRRPYLGRSRKEIRDAILNKQAQIKDKDIPKGYSKEAADFVNRCLKRQPAQRLGMQGCEEVKSHPWFKDFDWDSLKAKTLKPTFVPNIEKKNFDDNHVNNRGWNDEDEIQEYQALLKRQSQKMVFDNYYFDKKTIPLEERMATDFTNVAADSEDFGEFESNPSSFKNSGSMNSSVPSSIGVGGSLTQQRSGSIMPNKNNTVKRKASIPKE